jgi:UDP-glucose 4-epimerase
MSMRIIVTGAAGFVGSHIAELLVDAGHEVIIIDDFSSGVNLVPLRASMLLVAADLTVKNRFVESTLRGADAIVHCAAYANLRHWTNSEDERERLRAANVDATARMLEQAPPVPIVYLGTASVYGSRPGHAFVEGEESPETCESWYAATKLTGEHLVAAWAHWKRTPWHVARLVNVVGARTHRGVLHDFVQMHREAGRIHAADDGSQRKSWVHVADVAQAVGMMLGLSYTRMQHGEAKPVAPPPSGVYNVTSAERWSWRDIIREMGVRDFGWEERAVGAVGDPRDLHVSGEKLAPWFRCERPVVDGVRDALKSLGWERSAA